jgi:hypothetical protein
MSLAAILGLYLSLGWLPPAVTASASPTPRSQSSASASLAQAIPAQETPAQNPGPAGPLPSPTGQAASAPAQAKPSPARTHHKKTVSSNCSNSPTTLNPSVGKGADSTNSPGTGSAKLKPCPPPKKVVRNGGSDEPTIQLTGGTAAEQASEKSSTGQLTAATEDNLKKAAELQLNPSQQEMVRQIKQFMEQSKAAVAAGDLESGHNLALKAHLLSDELVKP